MNFTGSCLTYPILASKETLKALPFFYNIYHIHHIYCPPTISFRCKYAFYEKCHLMLMALPGTMFYAGSCMPQLCEHDFSADCVCLSDFEGNGTDNECITNNNSMEFYILKFTLQNTVASKGADTKFNFLVLHVTVVELSGVFRKPNYLCNKFQ